MDYPKDTPTTASDSNDDFNPYNPLNHKITLNQVQSILSKYGLPPIVHNIAIYQRAFVHSSYVKPANFKNQAPSSCLPLSTKSNQRLEFLGDGILECITKYLLYTRFPINDEGFMTKKKIEIVKNESIGKMAMEMGLHKWFIISRNAEEKKTRTNIKQLGCLFEAFIGAIFLDMNKITIHDKDQWFQTLFTTGPGFQMAQIFIEKVFEQHIQWDDLILKDENYKNILQVKIQKEFKVTPHYIQINTCNDDGYQMGVYLCVGQPIFHCDIHKTPAVNIRDFNTFKDIHRYIEEHHKIFLFLGEGQHNIKRKAEQMACYEALQIIDSASFSSAP
jgi:dsRNA-specific ribonuclease